jgi:hypothetical protein
MRRTRIASALMVAALSLVYVSINAQSEVDQLRAVERARLRSLVEADIETAQRVHADDFQLVDPSGATSSKEQYLGQVASGELDYLTWEPETIEVRRYGDGAVLRYRAQAQAIFRGQRVPLRSFWHTDVYEKRNGRWEVVWSQATLVQ